MSLAHLLSAFIRDPSDDDCSCNTSCVSTPCRTCPPGPPGPAGAPGTPGPPGPPGVVSALEPLEINDGVISISPTPTFSTITLTDQPFAAWTSPAQDNPGVTITPLQLTPAGVQNVFTAAGGTITVSETGMYEIQVALTWTFTVAGSQMFLRFDRGAIVRRQAVIMSAGQTHSITQVLFRLTAGDSVQISIENINNPSVTTSAGLIEAYKLS